MNEMNLKTRSRGSVSLVSVTTLDFVTRLRKSGLLPWGLFRNFQMTERPNFFYPNPTSRSPKLPGWRVTPRPLSELSGMPVNIAKTLVVPPLASATRTRASWPGSMP